MDFDQSRRVAMATWLTLGPRDDEAFDYLQGNLCSVKTGVAIEQFDVQNEVESDFIWILADRLQAILMEYRQEFVVPCPLHPTLHPLTSQAVAGRPSWVCPSTEQVIRSILEG